LFGQAQQHPSNLCSSVSGSKLGLRVGVIEQGLAPLQGFA
jgi:hypothetical protein